MENLILYGMRGSGKSTVGKSLSEKIDYNFYDLDKEIEKNIGEKLNIFVKKEGFETFREIESEVLQLTIKNKCDKVISLGGGTITYEKNINLLKDNMNKLIYIEVDIDNLIKRILYDESIGNKRNPLTDKGLIEELHELLNKRKIIYESIYDIKINNNGKVDTCVNSILDKVSENRNQKKSKISNNNLEDGKNNKTLNFIKKIINNPGKFSEDEKYKMLEKIADIEVSSEELSEIIKFIKSKQKIDLQLNDSIDICGTGGSNLPRINTSTLTAFELAKEGIKIAKHGNNASSGRFGSFDLIESLGYKIGNNSEEILEEYEKNNLAFLHAKEFFPFFKEFAVIRKKIGKPTVFNILGPLLNPANSDYQVIGCSDESKMRLMIETCKLLGRKNVMVVRGEDGLDEVTLSGKTKVFELKNGDIKEYYITPENYGFETVELSEIMTEKNDEKINIAKGIISGKEMGSYSKLVELNKKVTLDFYNKNNEIKR